MKKRENILMGVGIILLVISIIGVSYAAFSYTGAGSKLNTITTGIISMSYTESDNVISMDKALPTTDATGKVRLRDGEYFDFTVESTIEGNAIINYEVAAEALSSNTFDGKNVKLYLTKINGTTEEEIMLPKLYMPRTTANTKTGRPAGMLNLVTGSMGASETIKYRLRMYVKEGYNPQDDNGNEVFQVKINVYGKVAEEPTGTLIKANNNLDEFNFQNSEYKRTTSSVVTKNNNEIPATAVASWDISQAGDGSAVAYVEDDGKGAGTYKLTLGGEGGLLANPDMDGYFELFNKVETIDLTYLNTSNVTTMDGMFRLCSQLISLNIDSFDTSNVTTMSGMFQACRNLSVLNVDSFDTQRVTNMQFMFSECRSLNKLDLRSFDTSKVTNMTNMFLACSSLTTIDLSSFDTSNVTTMDGMFGECSSLGTLDLNNFDTSKVTDMSFMFNSCSSLTTLNLNVFDTSSVTTMEEMFSYCPNLVSIDVTSFQTTKVTIMAYMFAGCSSLTSLDLSGFDFSNLEYLYSDTCTMLQDCPVSVMYEWASCDT